MRLGTHIKTLTSSYITMMLCFCSVYKKKDKIVYCFERTYTENEESAVSFIGAEKRRVKGIKRAPKTGEAT